jgi:hypothetical protein
MKIQQQVNNPDFLTDIKDFFNLAITTDEINKIITNKVSQNPLSTKEIDAGVLPLDKRLETFIDRIEFIKHLEILSNYAKKKNFIVDCHEVKGVNYDISALRLYFALTCIDIFCDIDTHKEYFESVFKAISSDLKKELNNNLKIIEDGNTGTYDIVDFSEFFYNIRNWYTHSGLRFHSDGTKYFRLTQKFIVGTKKRKKIKELQIEYQFDLTNFILNVAKEKVENIFGW